jgi:hypothetical protein
VLGARELEELRRVGEAAADAPERGYERFEGLLFLAEVLGALLVAPDGGVRQLALDFRQPLLFACEVKDTSAARPTGPAGR